jgi:hypothetical protein
MNISEFVIISGSRKPIGIYLLLSEEVLGIAINLVLG